MIILAIGFGYTFRVARVEDQAGGLQAAADAAALAGAQTIVADMPAMIAASIAKGQPLPGGLGAGSAGEFASRNDAVLVSYSYSSGSDRVEVRVRSRQQLETGKYEDATASARLGLRLATCKLPKAPPKPKPTPKPTPTPVPSGSPTPTPTPPPLPPPPPDYSGTAVCGELKLPVKVSGAAGKVQVTLPPAAIKELFTPALSR